MPSRRPVKSQASLALGASYRMSGTKRARDDGQIAPEPDVELVVAEGEVVEAHSQLLSFASEYFARLFTGEWVEARTRRVELPDQTAENLKDFLDFILPGSKPLTNKRALKLLPVFDRFQCPACLQRVDDRLSLYAADYVSWPFDDPDWRLLEVSFQNVSLVKSRAALIRIIKPEMHRAEVMDAIAPFLMDSTYAELLDGVWPTMRNILLTPADRENKVLLSPPPNFEELWPIMSLSIKRERFLYNLPRITHMKIDDNWFENGFDYDGNLQDYLREDIRRDEESLEGLMNEEARKKLIRMINDELPGQRYGSYAPQSY